MWNGGVHLKGADMTIEYLGACPKALEGCLENVYDAGRAKIAVESAFAEMSKSSTARFIIEAAQSTDQIVEVVCYRSVGTTTFYPAGIVDYSLDGVGQAKRKRHLIAWDPEAAETHLEVAGKIQFVKRGERRQLALEKVSETDYDIRIANRVGAIPASLGLIHELGHFYQCINYGNDWFMERIWWKSGKTASGKMDLRWREVERNNLAFCEWPVCRELDLAVRWQYNKQWTQDPTSREEVGESEPIPTDDGRGAEVVGFFDTPPFG